MEIGGKKMNGQVAAQFFNWYCEKNFTFFNKDQFKDNKPHRTVKNKQDSWPSYKDIEKKNDIIYYEVMVKFKELDVNKQTQLEFILTHLKV